VRHDFEVVDLTMRLNDSTPVYPGDPAVDIDVTATFEDAGYFNTRLSLGCHIGTHIDAEGHMIPGGRMLDSYPLDRFHGRGVLLDVRSGAATPDVLGAGIDDGCIVLLWTGLSNAQHEPDYYSRVPELPMGLVDGLIACGVKMVGVDAGSIDGGPFAIHKALLSQGILIAENLVGFSAIASRAGSKVEEVGQVAEVGEFTVWALPLNLETEASPARIVAAFQPSGGEPSSLGDQAGQLP